MFNVGNVVHPFDYRGRCFVPITLNVPKSLGVNTALETVIKNAPELANILSSNICLLVYYNSGNLLMMGVAAERHFTRIYFESMSDDGVFNRGTENNLSAYGAGDFDRKQVL